MALTVAQIVSEGLLHAGDTSLTTRATAELTQWLRSQYAGFLWPFLRRELAAVALNSGVQTLTFGQGSGGINEEVQRIMDPLRIYTADFSVRNNVRILTDWSDDLDVDQTINNPAGNRGLPEKARVIHDTVMHGKWQVVFNRVADRNYLLKISYFLIPADPAASDVPIYPNQRTLIQAVNAFALKYKKSEEYDREVQILVAMVNEDRLKYTTAPGVNDTLSLDPRVFR